MSSTLPVLTAAWIVLLTLPAAVTDARRGLIPNALTLPSLLAAPLAAWWLAGVSGLAEALLGGFACGAVPLVLYGSGAGGGGDVKLLAALGAVAGARLGLEIQLASFLLASAWALGVLALRGGLRASLARALGLALRPLLPRRLRDRIHDAPATMTSVRLGPAVFAAAALVLGAQCLRLP